MDFGEAFEVSNILSRELMTVDPRHLTLNRYRSAINELAFKWITTFAKSDVGGIGATHHIPQMLVNFGLEFNPDTHLLTFTTTKRAATASRDHMVRGARGRGGRGRGGAGRGQGGARGGGRAGGGAGGRAGRGGGGGGGNDSDDLALVTVTGNMALLEAYKSEQVVAHHLLAFVRTDHLEFGQWTKFRNTEAHKVMAIVGNIDLAHRILQSWYCLERQSRDSITDASDPECSEHRDFPAFYEGCQGRLRYHMEHMTPYRQTLHFVLSKCREMKLRRHGKCCDPVFRLVFRLFRHDFNDFRRSNLHHPTGLCSIQSQSKKKTNPNSTRFVRNCTKIACRPAAVQPKAYSQVHAPNRPQDKRARV